MPDKFYKGFYKFFSNIFSRAITIWLALVFTLTLFFMKFTGEGFLKSAAIVSGISISVPLIFVIAFLIADFLQKIYNKGKRLTEEDKKDKRAG